MLNLDLGDMALIMDLKVKLLIYYYHLMEIVLSAKFKHLRNY